MSYQDRPIPSEPTTDDPGDRLERPRPEQGVGQEGASAGDRARETASTRKVSRRRRAGFVRVAAGSRLPDKEAIMATTEGLVGLVHVTANIAGQALYGSSAAI
jgi:hypothetical protein